MDKPRPSDTPRMLVVIPTLNESRNIERVLTELSAGLPGDISVRFVVADGGSQDGTVAIVERIAAERGDVILLHNPDRLQSAAVNLAVARYGADAELLVRCDAHAEYPEGFLAALARSRKENGADAIVVPMDSVGETPLQRAIAWASDSPIGSGGSAHRGGKWSGFVDHGHHALFLTEHFRRVGGYDPTYTHNEDAEFDCRQRAAGSRIFLDASIRISYSPRRTLAALARQYFNYGRGRSRTVRRHPGSMRMRQLAIPVHVLLFAGLPFAPVLPLLAVWPALYVAILGLASIKIAIDHRSPHGLLACPAAATMHFAWGAGFLWGLLTRRERRWSLDQCRPLKSLSTAGAETPPGSEFPTA